MFKFHKSSVILWYFPTDQGLCSFFLFGLGSAGLHRKQTRFVSSFNKWDSVKGIKEKVFKCGLDKNPFQMPCSVILVLGSPRQLWICQSTLGELSGEQH